MFALRVTLRVTVDRLWAAIDDHASNGRSTAVPTCSRSLTMSLVGAFPKKRPYSLLNCEALTYPTCRPAEPASIIGDNISRLVSPHQHLGALDCSCER